MAVRNTPLSQGPTRGGTASSRKHKSLTDDPGKYNQSDFHKRLLTLEFMLPIMAAFSRDWILLPRRSICTETHAFCYFPWRDFFFRTLSIPSRLSRRRLRLALAKIKSLRVAHYLSLDLPPPYPQS